MSAPSPSSTTSLVAPSSSSISALFTSARQQELASAQKPATSRHLHLHVQAHMSNSTGHTATSGQAEMTPIAWDAHFDQRRMVSVPRIPPAKADSVPSSSGDSGPDEFCVYSAQPTSFAALPRPPFVTLLIHGGGHTSLAWACVAGLLKKTMAVLAYDLRGHGHTRTSDEQDLSLERLVDDTVHVVHAIYGAKPPPLLVIGHSLGAAIGVHVAASKRLPVAALVVVDLVEGSAVSSMSHMTTVIASRPVSFESREDAVRWSLMVGAMRNAESARCSVPDQLVHIEHTGNVENNEEHRETPSKLYRWRTDLISTQPHWSGWFCGLSSLFLSCPLPKLLMLAGSDRLDTPMMIAHMQGKLQLEVMANTGHSIQEDQPKETARKLMEFVQRHKLYSMGAAWAQTEAKGASTAAAVPQASTASAAAASSTTPQQPSAVPRASSTTPQRPPVPLFHE